MYFFCPGSSLIKNPHFLQKRDSLFFSLEKETAGMNDRGLLDVLANLPHQVKERRIHT